MSHVTFRACLRKEKIYQDRMRLHTLLLGVIARLRHKTTETHGMPPTRDCQGHLCLRTCLTRPQRVCHTCRLRAMNRTCPSELTCGHAWAARRDGNFTQYSTTCRVWSRAQNLTYGSHPYPTHNKIGSGIDFIFLSIGYPKLINLFLSH